MSKHPTVLYRGSCLCGGICFTMTGEPVVVANCFCSDCQKNAGGPFQTIAVFATAALLVQDPDELERSYVIERTRTGKKKEKRFCARCGCTLWTVVWSAGDHLRFVRASLVEGWAEKLRPSVEVFTKNRPEGIPPVPGARQFETNMSG